MRWHLLAAVPVIALLNSGPALPFRHASELHVPTTRYDDSTLKRVTITFYTHNDNKDHDTKLNVSVVTKVSVFLSKDLASGSNLGGDMEFVDPSTHSFDLGLSAGAKTVTVKDLGLPVVNIDIQPHGHDRWIFDYTVTLDFGAAGTFTSKKQGAILDQDNKHFSAVFES